jgi:hypothetical protein
MNLPPLFWETLIVLGATVVLAVLANLAVRMVMS